MSIEVPAAQLPLYLSLASGLTVSVVGTLLLDEVSLYPDSLLIVDCITTDQVHQGLELEGVGVLGGNLALCRTKRGELREFAREVF